MKDRAEKCFERCCELAKKNVSSLQQVSTPCMDDHLQPRRNYETSAELCASCAQIVHKCCFLERNGRPDSLWSVKYSGKVSSKMEEGLRQKIANVDPLQSIKPQTTDMVYSKMLHVQVTCGTQNQCQEACWAYWIAYVCSHFVDVQEANRSFLTAVSSLKIFRLMQVDEWMVYQRFNFGNVCWNYHLDQPRRTLSVINAIESFFLIHILIFVYFESIDPIPPNISNTSQSTKLYLFQDSQCGSDPNHQQRT